MGKRGPLKEIWIRELGEEEGLKKWEEYSKRLSDSRSGKNNPMYGRKRSHSKEVREKISRGNKGKKVFEETKRKMSENSGTKGKSLHDIWTEKFGKEEADKRLLKFKDTMSKATSGENNPSYGKKRPGIGNHKSLYQCWLDKYDKEEADKRYAQWKNKVGRSGKNNSMYGKSSPKKSGSGYQGHYKGWYFRSAIELAYMINVIEKNNLRWENGEKKKFTVKYQDLQGIDRTYKPDFYLVKQNKIIEIKPSYILKSEDFNHKAKCAEQYFNSQGINYEVITDKDIKTFNRDELNVMHEKGIIKLNEHTLRRINSKIKEIEEKTC